MDGIPKREGYRRVRGEGTTVRRSLFVESELDAEWGMRALSEILDGWGRCNCVPDFSTTHREQGGLESRLLKFQSAAHVLLKWHLRGNSRQLDLALAAYDAGIADGFYGSGSAIAIGLLVKLKSMAENRATRRSLRIDWMLLDRVIFFGNWHGRSIKDLRREAVGCPGLI
ncbi:hypothetical protein [Burkholderia ubonensis]|uniref:hypothetical protein n=1 Tax=Burkholderia ubonensis TaxID=101571 RepID=UPI001160727A|nr:hypothetical protein [Burkholderia ubonensis]